MFILLLLYLLILLHLHVTKQTVLAHSLFRLQQCFSWDRYHYCSLYLRLLLFPLIIQSVACIVNSTSAFKFHNTAVCCFNLPIFILCLSVQYPPNLSILVAWYTHTQAHTHTNTKQCSSVLVGVSRLNGNDFSRACCYPGSSGSHQHALQQQS